MYNFLLDSDALIKISKANFFEELSEVFDIQITQDVYNEAVTEGKKRLYQDAEKIEKIIHAKKINILSGYEKNKKPLHKFGKGEVSIYQAAQKNTIIVTDDLSFTNYLKKEKRKSISPTHLILTLVKKGKLSKEKALSCLARLKPYIRNEIADIVKKEIMEEKK